MNKIEIYHILKYIKEHDYKMFGRDLTTFDLEILNNLKIYEFRYDLTYKNYLSPYYECSIKTLIPCGRL